MPPPCLPRHLRPCHPPWSARPARSAPDSPRTKSSTASGDAALSWRLPTKPAANWWTASGSTAASPEAGAQTATPPAAPSAPSAPVRSVTREERAKTQDGVAHAVLHNDPGYGPTITKHVTQKGAFLKSAERTIRFQAESPAPEHAVDRKEAATTDGEDAQESASVIHRNDENERAVATTRTSRVAEWQAASLAQGRQSPPTQEGAMVPRHSPFKHTTWRYAYDKAPHNTGEAPREPRRPDAFQREPPPVAGSASTSVERHADSQNESIQTPQKQEHVTMRRQLQTLLDQVKMLQARLDETPSSVASASLATTRPTASLTELEAPPEAVSTGSAEKHPCTLSVPFARTSWRRYNGRLRTGFTPPEHAIWAAVRQYRASARLLKNAFITLQKFSSPGVVPIASVIQSQLCNMARDSFLEDDYKMNIILKDFKDPSSPSAVPPAPATSVKSTKLMQSDTVVLRDEPSKQAPRTTSSTTQLTHIRSTASSDRVTNKPSEVRQDYRDARQDEETLWDSQLNTKTQGNVVSNEMENIRFKENQAGQKKNDQRLVRHIQTPSHLMKTSDSSNIKTPISSRTISDTQRPPEDTTNIPQEPVSNAENSPMAMPPKPIHSRPHEMSKQSLLDELFPEASGYIQPHHPPKRTQYPKLDLPDSTPLVRRELVDRPQKLKEHVVASFQRGGEEITALQLIHCSTGLTESDFRRLIPKGKHIESWVRDGEFYKVVPGRDPLSLERLPFYYLLFKTPESALAYQKNVSRLHKLSALHGSSDIFSAIPPPKGFLEDGEDLATAISSYFLKPTTQELRLHTVMQPYNPALRGIIAQGGYKPIVPDVDENGKRIYKVLVHIEGYEPSQWDLWQIFMRHAHDHGIIWPFHPESSAAIHRLREVVNLKTKLLPVSSVNPRAFNQSSHSPRVEFDDPSINSLMASPDDENTAKEINQMVMNRVYNRWIVDFAEEDAARRFAVMWHRKVLPELVGRNGKVAWRDAEGVQMCNCEFLW